MYFMSFCYNGNFTFKVRFVDISTFQWDETLFFCFDAILFCKFKQPLKK